MDKTMSPYELRFYFFSYFKQVFWRRIFRNTCLLQPGS